MCWVDPSQHVQSGDEESESRAAFVILQHLAQIGAQGRFHLAPSTLFSVSSHSLGPAAEEENRLDTKPVKGRLLGSFRLAVKRKRYFHLITVLRAQNIEKRQNCDLWDRWAELKVKRTENYHTELS